MHRKGKDDLYGVPLTSDFLLALSFSSSEGSIYELKIPRYLIHDVNQILKAADIQDPARRGGGDASREFLVWHTIDRNYIQSTIRYPLLNNVAYTDLQFNQLVLFLGDISKKDLNYRNWREWSSEEYLDMKRFEI